MVLWKAKQSALIQHSSTTLKIVYDIGSWVPRFNSKKCRFVHPHCQHGHLHQLLDWWLSKTMFQKKFCEIGLGTVHSKAAAAATAKAENERERNFVNICHLGLHFVYDSCCMPLYLDFPLLCMSHSLCIPTYLVSIVSPLPFPINVYIILSVYLPTYLATYLPCYLPS